MRPFKLNLKKKSEPLPCQAPLLEASLGTGSSAKRCISFDAVISPQEMNKDTLFGQSIRLAPSVKNNEKSWYEQTLEEEEDVAELSPLGARFASSIRINEPRMEPPPLADKVMRCTETREPSDFLPNANAALISEVEAYALEWDSNIEELGKVDLEWTEEDEIAYKESAQSMAEDEIFLGNDDMLGEDLVDEKARETVDELDRTPFSTVPQAKVPLGRSKTKGKKREAKKDTKKKDHSSKAQFGSGDIHGAVSRKFLHLQGRFSAKPPGKNPALLKPRQVKNSTSSHSSQRLNLSSKDLGNQEPVGMGNRLLPPDTGTRDAL